MCSGESTRQTQGGSIVLLTPPSNGPQPTLNREISLRLADNLEGDRTTARLSGLADGCTTADVIIHRYGDMRSQADAQSEIMYSFRLPTGSAGDATFTLANRLSLCVGDEGVIGRRVSLMDGRTVLGEGIMGWN
ncbi:hypothetical protein LTR10_006595 [Elasticomyces elasticus]|nr:hypothetical protein LTR10_006595 [Elasticomyces elasticus]